MLVVRLKELTRSVAASLPTPQGKRCGGGNGADSPPPLLHPQPNGSSRGKFTLFPPGFSVTDHCL